MINWCSATVRPAFFITFLSRIRVIVLLVVAVNLTVIRLFGHFGDHSSLNLTINGPVSNTYILGNHSVRVFKLFKYRDLDTIIDRQVRTFRSSVMSY